MLILLIKVVFSNIYLIEQACGEGAEKDTKEKKSLNFTF